MKYLTDRKPNESSNEYRDRIFDYKFKGIIDYTWKEIQQLFEEHIDEVYSDTKWRKDYKKYIESKYTTEEIEQNSIENTKSQLNELIRETQIERIKYTDVKNQNRAYIRRISREETLKEIALEAARMIAKRKVLLPESSGVERSNYGEAIIQLSDWHYGIDVNNAWNVFNTSICKRRVRQLLDETIAFCYTFGVSKVHITNLNDLIAGRIHNTIRLESRVDVITQTIEVSEMLAEFISELTANGIFVEYYDCLDNHSRLEPIKSESLELESLTRIIPWYLKTRLSDNPLVHINENEFGEDIMTFEVLDGKYTIGGVHGHKDKPSKVVDGLTMFTKVNYDMILTAHLHHFNCDEKNETVVVSNGSLMGTDTYAKDFRLSATPSQNIILCTPESVCDYIHRVLLK